MKNVKNVTWKISSEKCCIIEKWIKWTIKKVKAISTKG